MIKPVLTDYAHPDYMTSQKECEKFRFIMNGGDDFIEEYIVKFSDRESNDNFTARKLITPSAEFARAAIIDVKNAIFQRMGDIQRNGGSDEYQSVVKGLLGGVDRTGSSMNHFIGSRVLPELLFLGKIGIYVDMPVLDGVTKKDTRGKVPYFYTYQREDIINWQIDFNSNTLEFTKLLLRENYYEMNQFGLPLELASRYKLFEKIDGGVKLTLYNDKGEPITDLSAFQWITPLNSLENNARRIVLSENNSIILPLSKIPFVLLELDQPLTKSIANHQIALMNMESSDVSYTLKSNSPFYTEQKSESAASYLKNEENDEEGSEIEAGGNVGRAYGKGMDRPGFIHPSSEPLKASMEKQKNLKDDIRALINLALSNVKSKYTSAESKEMDERGLESGLSALGLVLEQGERELADIFSLYENNGSIATIVYPTRYSLKSDGQRLEEVEKLGGQRDKIPSKKCQKVISKKMATTLIGTDVSATELKEILDEIDNSPFITSSSEDLNNDLEKGLVSVETASKARGYNEAEAKKAEEDHAKRTARIMSAQSSAGARGIDDFKINPDDAKDEKTISQDPDLNDTGTKQVRGDE